MAMESGDVFFEPEFKSSRSDGGNSGEKMREFKHAFSDKRRENSNNFPGVLSVLREIANPTEGGTLFWRKKYVKHP